VEILSSLTRWVHVLAGVVWLGMLYYFNFVHGPFAGALDADVKRKVLPELMPRALFFFRWGAAWTWATGVLLLGLVFHAGGLMFDADRGWGAGAGVMALAAFLAPLVYDPLAQSPLGRNGRAFGAVGYALVVAGVVLMAEWAGFSYRAFNIHLGVAFGTIMAWNVWFRIWPAQQKILAAVQQGTAPDAELVALAGARSRHNTYMSVPLLWTMINAHTVVFAGGALGIPSKWSFVPLLVVVLLGWHVVFHLYRRAGRLKGL
jgi:uncharacterized membrane protein